MLFKNRIFFVYSDSPEFECEMELWNYQRKFKEKFICYVYQKCIIKSNSYCCLLQQKTPEFLSALIMFIKLIFILSVLGCVNLLVLDFCMLTPANIEYGYDNDALTLFFMTPVAIFASVLLWWFSLYMDSIYISIKQTVESSANPRKISDHSNIISKYLEKLNELMDKSLDKSSALLEKSFMRHETEDKNLDVEKCKMLTADFCEVEVDTKSNVKTEAKIDKKSTIKETV